MKELNDMSREELVQEIMTLRREMRLVSLRRRVTPHFLFNSLSVAMSLVMQSPKTAVLFLRHLARMYRYLLSYGDEYHVPIEQEMEMMQQYYELMAVRHVDCVHLDISPEVRKLKEHPLPPLALQGLLENAIKHNTHTKEHPLEVSLTVRKLATANGGDTFLCVTNKMVPLVADTFAGNANKAKATSGFGLAYMSETMLLLFKRDIRIENDGETFSVMIPLL